jgi:hypothetical protein
VVFCHLCAIESKPADIRYLRAVNRPSLKPPAAVKHWMFLAQLNQFAGKLQQILIGRFPVEPGNFVVLTVTIVVSILTAADFITSQ